MWKPDGYPSLSPYLITTGAADVMRFLEKALGAEPLRVFEKDDGSILHAEMRIADSVVMLGDAGGEWSPVPCHLHVYVEDVDATYRAALESGATSVQPPERKDGERDRRGGVLGPGGNTWWLATQYPE